MKGKYISLVCLTLALLVLSTKNTNAQFIWFEDIKEYKELDKKKSTQLIKSIYEVIKEKSKLTKDKIDLKKHEYPNIVFISASDSIKPSYVALGSGKNLTDAVNNTLSNLYKALPVNFDLKWLKLDLVNDSHVTDTFNFNKPINIDPTLSGIAFNQASGIALIPEEINSAVIISNKIVNKNVLASYLHNKEHRYNNYSSLDYWSDNKLYTFSTESYFYDGSKHYKLLRGHKADLEIDTETLHTSARLAGTYFLNTILPDGSFVYRYDTESDLSANYNNILGHAGYTYALVELFENSGNESVLQKARLSIDYLKRFTKECNRDSNSYLCVIDEHEHLIYLGANGLASAVVAKYIKLTDDKSLLEYLSGVNGYILNSIKDDGEFYPQTEEYFTCTVRDTKPDYYPGMAILGLLMSYEITNDKELLDAAEKATDYLINIRDKNKTVDDISHDPWLVYTLSRLYEYKPDKKYLNHIFKISDSIVKAQEVKSPTNDLNEGYDISVPIQTATWSKALSTAYHVANQTGSNKKAEIYLKTLRILIMTQLHNQYRPESVMYRAYPQQYLGGFKGGYNKSELHNVYLQHNLTGILDLLKILEVNKF